ncbi:MAG: rhomboid family intramembrane serine protease [Frankiaceae bacterium]
MVIPIHDDNPVRRTPVVTYALIIVNVVVFVLLEPINHVPSAGGSQQTTLRAYCQQVAFFDEYAAIPKELLTNEAVRHHEVVQTSTGQQVSCSQVTQDYFPHKQPALSALYSMFLHGGWLHLLGNMLFLYIFGNNIEDRLGRVRYLLFYLAAGYAAAYGFALANADSTTTLVGASGAIAGVLGAYLVLYPRARVRTLIPIGFIFIWPRLPAWVVLGFWFLLQYWYSVGGGVTSGAGVAYLAHVVGFLFGALLALPLRAGTRPPGYGPPGHGYGPRRTYAGR